MICERLWGINILVVNECIINTRKILLDRRHDDLLKVRWNDHLVSYCFRYGINTSILHL